MLVLMKNRTCSVEDCTSPSHLRDLCVKHYARVMRHGSTESLRPDDYGERRSHPFWQRWTQLKRRGVLCPEWYADMWRFVEAVTPQPENAKKLRRLNEAKPFGPGNWEWAKTPTREETIAYSRAYHSANPDRARDSHFRKKYGIGIADYEAMYAAQDGACAICGGEESRFVRRNRQERRMLCVDHDHETGAVRGLLCGDCNVALGAFDDDLQLLALAVLYLREHKRRSSRAA